MNRRPAQPVPQHSAPHRFRLGRAGILNVWQYDQQEFEFGEGRLLLRGKNGAGKSKALEMLLPYLLDGDARALDATGTGRTTLAWLMLDGFEQTNRLGYLWVEFRRTDEDGAERYLTVGAAVRASKSTNVATPFFFTTTMRVGEDLQLVESGQPLALDRLRAAVGAGNVLDSARDHRTRVARELFGLSDASRYRNLVHLLHRLRRPTIGDRIESGGLVTVLGETLPALDDDVIDSVARNLDDLDSVRKDLGRLERTDEALRRFLGNYRGYLHGALRRRSDEVVAELHKLTERRLAAGEIGRRAAELRGEASEARGRHEQLVEEQDAAEAELATLRASSGYRSLSELGERRRTVEAVHATAGASFAALRLAHDARSAVGAALTAGAGRTAGELRELGTAHRELRELAERSGLAPAHLGDPVTGSLSVLAVAAEDECTDPDGGTELLRGERVAAFDTAAVAAALRSWNAQLAAAEPVIKSRLRAVAELGSLLDALRGAEQRAREADTAYERLAEQAQAEAERVTERQSTVVTRGEEYAGAVHEWAALLTARSGVPLGPVTEVVRRDLSAETPFEERTLPASIGDEVASAAYGALEVHRQALAEQRDQAALVAGGLARTLDALRAEKADWGRHSDPVPPKPPLRDAPRLPDSGAPLYRLVDFSPDLTEAQQAGVEAALEAAGLLDAWVCADGVLLDPHTRDTVLTPTAPVDGWSLAHALRPVPAAGHGVTAAQVARLLSAVALAPGGSPLRAAAGGAVSTDGRWRLGTAGGAHTKPVAEFVGAEVRAGTRRRRIAELTSRISEVESEAEVARSHAQELTERRDALDDLLRRAPTSAPLAGAWARLEEAERIAADLRQAATVAGRAAQDARAGSVDARRHAEAAATAHALPADQGALLMARAALDGLADGTRRLRRRVADTAEGTAAHEQERRRYDRARSALEAAGLEYGRRAAELAAARREIRTLEGAVGATEQEILDEEQTAVRRLDAIGKELPTARRKAEQLHDDLVRAEQDEGTRRAELATQEEAVIRRGRALRTALATPDIARGAELGGHLGELSIPDPAHEDARARLKALQRLVEAVDRSLDAQRRDVSDTALLNRFSELRDQLAGGYDATLEEPDGIKVCRLVDDSGPHDVALVGERIATQAADARARLTDREREVFQRFLTGELGDHLSSQMLAAGALVDALNATLHSVRTSHGLGVELDWRLADTVDADVRAAVDLLRSPSGLRTREQSEQLREILQRRIEDARRADPAVGYAAHLRTALDYRSWFTFQPWVLDESSAARRRKFTGRTGLSQGEQRVLSYLALFAAAAAQFTTLAESAPHAPRLILLDDAFAKVDEPTHARLGRILVDLDLDFVLTSERLMGNWPDVPALQIYECLRDPQVRGVATLHYVWNGRNRRLVSV
ncbi:TIGR02680 family protein [Kitasatospora sp. NBC_01287]|uniref:TIGR02680 family protein n=1 Tax=Kitasatospora sp. NBC_01287 TaxID=2903573 RepID=UPI00225782C8|nr:TIGR02680 family protein [Kitasatospora sp. NBC_01287]MCX4745927.1 TIGR02680 family protein [Kitasatospora sp. NBC_01287]